MTYTYYRSTVSANHYDHMQTVIEKFLTDRALRTPDAVRSLVRQSAVGTPWQ